MATAAPALGGACNCTRTRCPVARVFSVTPTSVALATFTFNPARPTTLPLTWLMKPVSCGADALLSLRIQVARKPPAGSVNPDTSSASAARKSLRLATPSNTVVESTAMRWPSTRSALKPGASSMAPRNRLSYANWLAVPLLPSAASVPVTVTTMPARRSAWLRPVLPSVLIAAAETS